MALSQAMVIYSSRQGARYGRLGHTPIYGGHWSGVGGRYCTRLPLAMFMCVYSLGRWLPPGRASAGSPLLAVLVAVRPSLSLRLVATAILLATWRDYQEAANLLVW